jgi:hypothetical protein
METNGSISADEASAALASARDSRARATWGGYPAWYWFATATGLAVGSVAMLLPDWWDAALVAPVAVSLAYLARVAGRARGICEGWMRHGMTWREALVLYGPAIVVILASGAVSRYDAWSPWASIVAAVLVFVLFAGTGLTLTARAARR